MRIFAKLPNSLTLLRLFTASVYARERKCERSAKCAGVGSCVCERSSFPYLKTPINDETGQMNRNQARLIYFFPLFKQGTLNFVARFYPSLF